MTLLRRATEQQQSDWREVAEGVWRWVIGTPEVSLSEQYGKYGVRFPLTLTPTDQERLKADLGEPPEGTQQSWRNSYRCGLSLGYIDRNGAYQTTKLVDFLAAALGSSNAKRFREWIAQGGGPPKAADPDDQQMELDEIRDWLHWWEGLELYGTVRHEQDSKDASKTWARFAGPMAVGSLPGQKDDDYQAHGRGKLRAIMAEAEADKPAPEPVAASTAPARTYEQVFGEDAKPPDQQDIPF